MAQSGPQTKSVINDCYHHHNLQNPTDNSASTNAQLFADQKIRDMNAKAQCIIYWNTATTKPTFQMIVEN